MCYHERMCHQVQQCMRFIQLSKSRDYTPDVLPDATLQGSVSIFHSLAKCAKHYTVELLIAVEESSADAVILYTRCFKWVTGLESVQVSSM